MCLTQTLDSICGSIALQESVGVLRDDWVKLPKLRVRSERGIQKGVYELCDEWKWLNFNLHIIRQARPRYQDLTIDMQPCRKPRSDEAFCFWGTSAIGPGAYDLFMFSENSSIDTYIIR